MELVPVVGAAISTWFSEIVPPRKQRRLVEFVQDLACELDEERDRVDADFVRSDEFQRMFEDTMERVQTVRNEDKLGYWAALLAGVAATNRPKPTDRERMIETLDGLRPAHLRLLRVIATTSQPRPGLYAGGVSDTLSWKMPDVSNDDARPSWGELARFNLVGGYPSGTMTAQGAGMLVAHLTPYGREFVRLLQLEAGFADDIQ